MDKYLFSYATASDPPFKRGVIRLVEKATGQPKLKRMYLENQRFPRSDESFWQAAVRSLALDVLYDPNALAASSCRSTSAKGKRRSGPTSPRGRRRARSWRRAAW